MTDDYLSQGIAAGKAGNKQEARRLLDAAIRAAPNDERTWGWFYPVCENYDERIRCLRQVLHINPNNKTVKKKLDELLSLETYFQSQNQLPRFQIEMLNQFRKFRRAAIPLAESC